MLSAIEVKRLPARPALVIATSTTADAIGATLAQLLPEVWGYATAQGATPAGPPFTRYLAWNADGTVELEAGIPVVAAIEGNERVLAMEMPEGEAAMVLYSGPYDGLGEAHAALGAWVQEHQRETAGPCWECYVTDPGAEPDPQKWRTEVYWPLR